MPQYDLAGNPLPESVSSSTPRTDLAGNPLPDTAPSVRYDLAGNPLPPSAPPTPVYAPAPNMGGGGAVWSPPAPASGLSWQERQRLNTSGQQGDVPPEIARLTWNWGAFFFYRLWCKFHGMTTLAAIMWGSLYAFRWILRLTSFGSPGTAGLLAAGYLIIDYSLAFYFGFSGHKLGWRNRRFDGGVEEYFKVQRAWMIGGFVWHLVQVGFILWLVSLVHGAAGGPVPPISGADGGLSDN